VRRAIQPGRVVLDVDGRTAETGSSLSAGGGKRIVRAKQPGPTNRAAQHHLTIGQERLKTRPAKPNIRITPPMIAATIPTYLCSKSSAIFMVPYSYSASPSCINQTMNKPKQFDLERIQEKWAPVFRPNAL